MTRGDDGGSVAIDAGGDREPGLAASVSRAITTIGVIQAITMAFNMLRSKVVAVAVGPEGVGVISLIDQGVALVAMVSAFSLPFASVKFLSAAHSVDREAFVRTYIAFLRALLLLSLLGTGVGTAIFLAWPGLLGEELRPFGGLVFIALLTIPATNLTGLVTNTMAAARRSRTSALLGLFVAAAAALLAGAGILTSGLSGYYMGILVAGLIGVAAGVWYLRHRGDLPLHQRGVSMVTEMRRSPEVLRFAGALYVISFTTPLAYLVARYALLHWGGLRAAGLLQASIAFAAALAAVLSAANALFLTPAMNRKTGKMHKFELAAEFMRGLAIAIGILGLPIVLFPNLWLYLLFSREFTAASAYVYLFVVATAIQLLAGVNQALMVGLDHIGTLVVSNLAAHAAIVGVSLSLVPHYGIAGVALAFILNALLLFIISAWRLWVSHAMVVTRAMGWRPVAVIGVIAAAGFLSTRLSTNTAANVLVRIVLWVVIALFLLKAAKARKVT